MPRELQTSDPDLFDARPLYVPPGYRLTSTLRGNLFAGFRGGYEQAMIIYATGWSDDVFRRPLAVHISGPLNRAVLFGTEKRKGQEVAFGVENAAAVYHDGRWELGSGRDQLVAGGVVLHWSLSDEHSLTIMHREVLYAVRGSRRNGIGLEDLLRVGESLLYPPSS